MTDTTTKYWRERCVRIERAWSKCFDEKNRLKEQLSDCIKKREEYLDELKRLK